MSVGSGEGVFRVTAPFAPAGDQPKATDSVVAAFEAGAKHHVLLGVTGSGKTYTMAKVIERLAVPTLVMAPNKTLAAQLYLEFKDFFPNDHVGYFISYYDYYQPEAYIPSSDTFIEKDSAINEDIDKMRHDATRLLLEKPNVIIVSSVSCIYGLGSPNAYAELVCNLRVGEEREQEEFLRQLIAMHYQRGDDTWMRGRFRVRGDQVDVLPSHEQDEAIRVVFFDGKVESIERIDVLSGRRVAAVAEVAIYPGSHYVTTNNQVHTIVEDVLRDLGVRLRQLKALGKEAEALRLETRVMADVEAFEQFGYCSGVENYSRYLSGLPPGSPPACLLDYFPKNFLTILDESHLTLPQIGGMFHGDRSRKHTLVEYGFRLPAALDNRPLSMEEFLAATDRVLHVSATPGPRELELAEGKVSEQVIRPTGLLDPRVEVVDAKIQIDHVVSRMRQVIGTDKGRVLITTLTKRMSENLTQYLSEEGFRVAYLHSDVDAIARVDILRGLRLGQFDVLVGINLLREGIDLPEVQLVAVLDADKEGFLRSRPSLIQMIGRAARNVKGQVILYAERMTESMREAIAETDRRRTLQAEFNAAHGIVPRSVSKPIGDDLRAIYGLLKPAASGDQVVDLIGIDWGAKAREWKVQRPDDLEKKMAVVEKKMRRLAAQMQFEQAAELRDQLGEMKALLRLWLDRGA